MLVDKVMAPADARSPENVGHYCIVFESWAGRGVLGKHLAPGRVIVADMSQSRAVSAQNTPETQVAFLEMHARHGCTLIP